MVDIKALDAEIDAHVARSVTFFLAACRSGGVLSRKAKPNFADWRVLGRLSV